MSNITPLPSNAEIDLNAAHDLLASLPAETLWLANFISPNTRKAYKNAVSHFMAVMGIDSQEMLYAASQGHFLAYREHLTEAGYSNPSISARLAALSGSVPAGGRMTP